MTHAAHQLEDDRQHAALVGDAAFDTFRHELVGLHGGVLEITVSRTIGHRAQRAHAAVRLVAAALVQDHFAWRFFRTGKHGTHHDGRGASGQRFRNIAREADTAVGDTWHARAFERFGDVRDGRDLRHAHTGDDTRGADRARTDADLDRIGAVFHQRLGGGGGSDVAANYFHLRVLGLDPAYAVQDALRVAVGRVDHQHVDASGDQQVDAFFILGTDADGSADQQLALAVFRRERVGSRLLDILDGDQAAQLKRVVDHQHALEAVLVHQALGFGRIGIFIDDDEFFARGHLGGGFRVEFLFKAQIAVGNDTDHFLALDDRETADAVLFRQRDHVADFHVRRNRDRIAQHASFETFYTGHFTCLVLRIQILVDDTDAAFLGHRDRQTGFRHRIHGCGQQGNIQGDIAGQASFEGRIGGQNVGVGWDEQHVIECECFLK